MSFKRVVLILLLVIVVVIGGLVFISNKDNKEENLKADYVNNIGAWLVEWDIENGYKEIEGTDKLDIISAFAISFNEDYELIIKDELIDTIDKLKEERKEKIYLTVVNDVINDDGTSIQKSTDLLEVILSNDIRKNHNINKLVETVTNLGVDGLDLDYEKVSNDIWNEYVDFIEKLGTALKSKGKELRVILEPRSPIDKVSLPEEYEYIMMAYNLYGYKTKPGPKADEEFIRKLCKSMNDNLKNVRIAFSLGGFSWDKDNNAKALSKVKIDEIIKNNNIEATRDEKSFAMTFDYVDEDGSEYTVWYSDETTIREWMNISMEYGINSFDLWRLGGNIQ